MFNTTRSTFKSRVNAGIQGRADMLIDQNDLLNEAARSVISDIDLRSARRRVELSGNLFDGIKQFPSPTDLKGQSIIDIPPFSDRGGEEFNLVTTEEFDRIKENEDGSIAIDDFNGIQQLLISKDVKDTTVLISNLDTLTAGGGTWEAFGNAENVAVDKTFFIRESGSIRYDIDNGSGTTAGIKNTSLTSLDISTSFPSGEGSFFVWHYLPSATGVTNFTLRVGNSEATYLQGTVTQRHDGTAFMAGFNLLRFDLSDMTDVGGTPDRSAITFVSHFMNKEESKNSEDNFRVDSITLQKGKPHYIKYYSKYPWQDINEVYKENSTDDADLLVADTDELNLYLHKARQLAAEEVSEFDIASYHESKYTQDKLVYQQRNPSEAKIMTNGYYIY